MRKFFVAIGTAMFVLMVAGALSAGWNPLLVLVAIVFALGVAVAVQGESRFYQEFRGNLAQKPAG